jgi:hypothetical protein
MRRKEKDRPDWKVKGAIAMRPQTQDKDHEKPLDPRRNPWTGQIAPVFIDEEDEQ